MNLTKLFYALIIVLLYVPMVFLGANVFFSQYTGENSYYHGQDCYMKYPIPTTCTNNTEVSEKLNNCTVVEEAARIKWEAERNDYDANKYTFMVLFNLIVLLIALLFKKLSDSVSIGLFTGTVVSTFASTIAYFDSNSKIGFVILVLTFIAALVYINRKKNVFLK